MVPFATNKTVPTPQKLRGGYYTPSDLAAYLSAWAIRNGSERVLEPSCGDGNFVVAAAVRLNAKGALWAIEIDPAEIDKARHRVKACQAPIRWKCADFFSAYRSLGERELFDVILGNPPFIRFQNFSTDAREQAFALLRTHGYRPTGLANTWCSFVQLGIELLKDGGRLAMVVPAELLQVQYAAELRARLPLAFDEVLIVGFDELVFPEIQQEVVLLLAEGRRRTGKRSGKFHTLQLRNGTDLVGESNKKLKIAHLAERHCHGEMKWTSLFLSQREFSALNSTVTDGNVKRLKEYAGVDVGIVTGRNNFFVLYDKDADALEVNGFALDVVGRTSALKSIIFDPEDIATYAKNYPSKLLNLRGIEEARFSAPLRAYIRRGEESRVNTGYKCRIRGRWFDVPSIYVPDAFLFRQIHHAPLLVANRAKATTTDTIHRVRVKSNVDVEILCASMVNSLTFAWAEVCGRSYGGGVLELEPREAEELPVIYSHADGIDREYVDKALRAGNLTMALEHGDDILLRKGMGLSKSDIKSIRSAWLTLKGRRQRRKYIAMH